MKKIIFSILIISVFTSFFFADVAKAEQKQQDSLIIKLKSPYRDFNFSQLFSLDKLNTNQGVQKIKALSKDKNSPLFGTYQLTFSVKKNLYALAREYEKNFYVEYAEPEFQLSANLFTPNDTYYSQQWNLKTINVPQAWEYDQDSNPYGGNSQIIVAILDTGISYENYGPYQKAPDLVNTNFVAGYDFVNQDSHPNDDNGHGTNMAEIIAASTNNAYGIAGIAFNVSLMPIKVMDSSGRGSITNVALGIEWAVDHGADIINMSIGTGEEEFYSETLYSAIKYANSKGVIMVGSTGNDSLDRIYYPAAYPEVIAVGATDSDNTLSSFSNYGQGIDLVAPGRGILAEYCVNGSYCSNHEIVSASGTSQAVPHVSAAAALLLSFGVSPEKIKPILTYSATDLGESGYDTTYGYGLLNISAALNVAASNPAAPVTTLTTNPTEANGKNGYFITNPTISLSATGQYNISAIHYRIDNGNWQIYQAPFTLNEGKHLIEYWSEDILNNKEINKNTSIYVDTTPPSLEISLPLNNQKIKGKILVSSGYFSDSISGIASLSLDGELLTTDSSFFSQQITLNKGLNNLTFILEDRAGHLTTLKRRVFSYPKNNIIVGLGPGSLPEVRGYNSSHQLTGVFLAYARAFQGGINVLSVDINNDGQEEIITAPISHGGPQVRILSRHAEPISGFMAYMESFHGGVNIAAGDVDGDGISEIITAAGPGGGPHIRIFDSQGNLKGQFMAYATSFRGGVNITVGDLNKDSKEEIITAPLSGGGPHVRIFDSQGNLKGQFFVYSPSFRGGLNLSVGDYDNDGTLEIITGVKSGLFPEIKIFEMDGTFRDNFYLPRNFCLIKINKNFLMLGIYEVRLRRI